MSELPRSPVIPRIWSADVRQRAYDLWAGPANGNQSEAARLLSAEIGETINVSTLNGWAITDRWKDRLALETADSTLMDGYVRRLWVAVAPALSTLSATSSGELTAASDDEHRNLDRRLTAARFIVDKAQQLLMKQADRQPKQGAARQSLAPDLQSLSSEQLEQLEQELRQQE